MDVTWQPSTGEGEGGRDTKHLRRRGLCWPLVMWFRERATGGANANKGERTALLRPLTHHTVPFRMYKGECT